MRAKREMHLQDVPDAISDDVRGPLERVLRAEDLEPDVVDGYLEETNENDETDRTLTVDPFSAEEERIITVLSRKLEQVRFDFFWFLVFGIHPSDLLKLHFFVFFSSANMK
jgi:hypothetical protein